jgi:hypothetical protein
MASDRPPTHLFKPVRQKPVTDRERVFSDSEAEGAVIDAEKSISNIRQSSAALRQELDSLHRKRQALLQARQPCLAPVPELPSVRSSLPLDFETSLAPEDIISNPEVLDFLHRHFLDQTDIPTEDFISAIERDYFDLTPDVSEELIRRVTIDPEYISLNRLKMLTAKEGLEEVIQGIIEELADQEQESADQVNETILTEIAELNDMITDKAKTLDLRESQVAAQAKDLQVQKNRLLDRIQTEAEDATKRCISDIKSQASIQLKRLQRLEKLLTDRLKASKVKTIPPEKPAKGETDKLASENARLKARVLALEKTVEALKGRNQGLEGELEGCKSQMGKISEELGRFKGRNSYLEQIAGDYKKLRESQSSKVLEPSAVSPPPPPAPLPSLSPALCLSLLDILVAGLSDTLPLYLNSPVNSKSLTCSQISSARSSVIGLGENWPGYGRLLYPTFNVLVPRLVEAVPLAIEVGVGVESVLGLLSALVIRAYADSLEDREEFMFPEKLNFQPSSDTWALTNLKKSKARIQPLYSLFSRTPYQKITVQMLNKLLTYPAVTVSLQASTLILLLSDSQKSIEKALRSLKSHLTDNKTKVTTWTFLITDPNDPLTSVEAVFGLGKEPLSVQVCEILLLLLVERGLGTQQRQWNGLLAAAEHAEDTELEEYIVVLVQKLVGSGSLHLQNTEILTHFANRQEQLRNTSSPQARFLMDNLASILDLSR